MINLLLPWDGKTIPNLQRRGPERLMIFSSNRDSSQGASENLSYSLGSCSNFHLNPISSKPLFPLLQMGMRILHRTGAKKTQWEDYVKHFNPSFAVQASQRYAVIMVTVTITLIRLHLLPLWEFILRFYLLIFSVRQLFASKWRLVLANIKWEMILLGVHILPSLDF